MPTMSFFLKSKSKQVNGAANKRKRRLPGAPKKSEEITSSEDEDFFGNSTNNAVQDSSEDENETAQEKKLRLAKVYLQEIEREERQRLEDKEVSKEILSKRLHEDHLKQIGKYEYTIADRFTSVDQEAIKILKCREQRNTVTCLCISHDDKFVFSGSKDGVIVKWCLKEYKKLGVIPFVKNNVDRILGHTSAINSLAVSTDNKFLVVGDNSSLIQIWDPETLQHVNTLKGHKKPVTGLCFKQNSHTLYSCSGDRSVRVWSLDDMAFVETLFGHQDIITSIDCLVSEKPITAGGRDGSIRLWKVNEESQLIFNALPESIDTVKLLNEQHFVSGGDHGQVCMWSSLKKKPVAVIKAAHGADARNSQPLWISAVTALVHSDLIASGSYDGFVRIWKLEDKCRKISKLFEVPMVGFVNALSFTSDGKYLVAAIGKDHRLGRWETVKSAVNSIRVIPLIENELNIK